ncbi:restriction endonuclease subunit S [Streptomyces sp. NPDC046870]|uniref:restriction endonuclease subunit S n=1 Tax=Streptomyces sp. NPDC046870 TaxID=3155135 RepID=UPI00345663A7
MNNAVRLRHLAQINPSTPAFDALQDDDELTFLPMEAVWPGSRLDISQRRTKKAVSTGYTRFQDGDVLVPKITPTFEAGRAVLIQGLHGGVGAGTTELHVVRPGKEIDPRFLLYTVNTHSFLKLGKAEMYGVAGQQRVPDEFLRDLLVPLPPLEEQRRIADFLDAETRRIDHLLGKLQSQRKLVTEREEASIPLTVAGALLHPQPVRTGVPWMPLMHPKAEVVPLARVLQLQRGVDLAESERVDGTVPVVTTAGLSGWHNRAIVDGPGVVIRRYGSRGNVHWVDRDFWPHNTTLYVKNFNGNNRRYCYHLLRSLPFEMEQAKSAIPGVNRNDLHRLQVAVLPSSLQESACHTLNSDMAKFQATHERIEKLGQLLAERRQALITAAVTGQFDVSTASGRNVTEGVSA